MANHHELSPGPHGNPIGCHVPAQAKQKLAVVFRKLNGKAMLDPIEVSSLDTGQHIFRTLKEKHLELAKSQSHGYWLQLLFTRLEVEIAEIRWTIFDANANKGGGLRVDLDACREQPLLTEALHRPEILANEPTFISNCDSLIVEPRDTFHNLAGQEVLVIHTVGDKRKIAWFLLLFLILSPVLGLIVGQFSHQAEVGVAVSAGVFALATFLQGLAAWLHT